MRLYNRAGFLALPEGTIFAQGMPWVFGGLCRKADTLYDGEGKAFDFCYFDLVDIDSANSGEWSERMQRMLELGESYPLNEDGGRDGLFDDEAIFLVYEPRDIERLAVMLGVKESTDE